MENRKIRIIFFRAENQADVHVLGDVVLDRYMPVLDDHRRPHLVVGSLEPDGGVDLPLGALHSFPEVGPGI